MRARSPYLARGVVTQFGVAFDVYPACEGGDGYKVPEAAGACAAWQSAPRSADLLMTYVRDSLGGKVAPPTGGRVKRAGS